MKLDDGELKRLMEDPGTQAPRAARGCPDPDVQLRVSAGEATHAERIAFADHLIACADCAEEYRAAKALASWTAEAAALLRPGAETRAAMPTARFDRRTGTRLWIALAAAAALAAAGLVLVARRGDPEKAASAERGSVEITRALEPRDRAALPASPKRLEWAPMEGASSYEATIYDAESTPLWKSPPVSATRVELPPEVRARLAPGHAYLWRVVARVDVEARSSPVFQFSIAR
jgi:hypothetical protein